MSDEHLAAKVEALLDELTGSGAYADIDNGVAAAVMRDRFTTGDITTIARIDQLIANELT